MRTEALKLLSRSLDLEALSRRAPALAGDIAYRLFSTPALSERRSPDHEALVARARFHLRGAERITVPTMHGLVHAFSFQPADVNPATKSVLIAHGWTSESSFMAVLAEQLRKAGFRVLAFDQPAHGHSALRRATLIDCTRALIEVAEALGPFNAVVAHSMGSMASLLAGADGRPFRTAVQFDRYVLISSPNRFSAVTAEFAAGLGLSRAAQRAFERRLERTAHRSMADFRADRMSAAIGRPSLLVHARDDYEVDFSCAEEIVAASPSAELMAFDGFGHRLILSAPPAVRAIVSYLRDM